jgi:hypothetical protein
MRFTRAPKRKERAAVGRFPLKPHNVIKVYKMFCVSVRNISYQIILLSTKRKIENPLRRFSRCLARWLPAWTLRLLILFRRSSFISQRERTVSRWGEAIHSVSTDRKRKSNSAKNERSHGGLINKRPVNPEGYKRTDRHGIVTLLAGCSLEELCNINAWSGLSAHPCFRISENTHRISIKFGTECVH